MKITSTINIRKSNGVYLLNGEYNKEVPQDQLEIICKNCRGLDDAEKIVVFRRLADNGVIPFFANNNSYITNEETIRSVMQEMINFFSEFQFLPNFRFVNTFAHKCHEKKAEDYVVNYFRLIDSPYAEEISGKIESDEFKEIVKSFDDIHTKKVVNDRLKIYFGPQGTGKTTAALKETKNLSIVCNASLLPSDLMEDFTFNDGKATFCPSILARCMEEGKPIVLDEINLLPFDSLRFLQGILDGKKEINYKGHTVHINDGFKVIGTMNLVVNGVVFGLPEPLADRCADISEYRLTADQLMGAII